jgi:hypothetical protein
MISHDSTLVVVMCAISMRLHSIILKSTRTDFSLPTWQVCGATLFVSGDELKFYWPLKMWLGELGKFTSVSL